jgi:predicted Rossmann-fold nucleotide-binding protein
MEPWRSWSRYLGCQLGLHTRPIVLINVNNFWRPFLQQTRRMAIFGFTRTGEGVLFRVVEFASLGIDLVETEVTRASTLPMADGPLA